MAQNDMKKAAGKKAADLVKDGMVVGIGSGSTIAYVIEALAKRVIEDGLQIIGVPTSERTWRVAADAGIPMHSVDDVDHIDITIDGADQINPYFVGIKGGGAALLWEKVVARNSRRNIWVVDESKMVDTLTFYLPIEVIPYGSGQLFRRFERLGYKPTWRLDQIGNFIKTDSGNYLIDLHFEKIEDAANLSTKLLNMVGVIEHGLFLDVVDQVVVGTADQVKIIDVPVDD